MQDKAIVLLSGGIDSAVALWLSKAEWECSTITINYYQRHQREIEAATTLAQAAGIKNHLVINMEFLREVADSYSIGDGDSALTAELAHPAYIPARNIVFYGVAASLAETNGAKWIVGGHHKEDTLLFPDSTETFFEAMNNAIRYGTWAGKEKGIEIKIPLSEMKKSEVILKGSELKVPFDLTYTCYAGREKPCGKCEACLARLKGFEIAGLKDPAAYE